MNLPNRLTMIRIACVPVYLLLKAAQTPLCNVLALILFIFAALTDLFDGHIARSRGLVTNFGKFMDPIADKLLIIPALILMVAQGQVPAWVCILFVAREFIVSGLRLIAIEQRVVIAAGNLGKLKTVLQIIAVALLTVNLPAFFWLSQIALYASLLLALWSGIEYVYNGRHLLFGGNDI